MLIENFSLNWSISTTWSPGIAPNSMRIITPFSLLSVTVKKSYCSAIILKMQVSATRPVCIASTAITGDRCLSDKKNNSEPIRCKRHRITSHFRISIGTSINERPLRKKKIKEALSWMKLRMKTTVRIDIWGGPFIRYEVLKSTGICVTIARSAAKR